MEKYINSRIAEIDEEVKFNRDLSEQINTPNGFTTITVINSRLKARKNELKGVLKHISDK